jgi:hypothetical protein
MGGDGGVIAYDFNGVVVKSFGNFSEVNQRNRVTRSFFTFSPDRTHLIAHGQTDWEELTAPAVTVHNIASGTYVHVNPELNGAGVVALSPDNRYLVMGFTALRVWDLQNLAENFDERLPLWRFPGTGSRITQVQFLDATRIQMTTVEGTVLEYDVLSR